jgi:hypothetical protein
MQAKLENQGGIVPNEQDPFLAPVEKPKGLVMKLLFYFVRRQFGKVLTR